MTTLLCLTSISAMATVGRDNSAQSTAAADDIVRVRHARFFVTNARKVVVVTPDSELTRRIGERLSAHGAVVVDDFLSKLFAPRVVVRRVAKIDGQSTAYCIEVGRSAINISYTSPDMLERAVKQFYFLFDSPYGQRIIRGENLYHYADQPAKSTKSTVKRNNAGITDGVTALLSTAQVESAIRAQLRADAGSDFMMAMVNRRLFRIDFSALRGINPKIATISDGQTKYSPDQIRRFVATAREAGGEFVPAIDLLSPNEAFEELTGHALTSVEGMRFVRSIIEQCARQWDIKRICIGRRDNVTEQRYIDFLGDIATNEGVTLIIL